MQPDKRYRILAILPRVPWPLEKGDKLRAYHQLRVLARKHEVHVWALSDIPFPEGAEENLAPLFASLTLSRLSLCSVAYNVFRAWVTGRPLQAGYFYNARVARQFREFVDEIRPDHLYFQLARTAWYAEGLDVPKTLDLQDAFSAGVKRRMERSPWYQRPLFEMEYRRMCDYERQICDRFSELTIISEADRELILHPDRDSIHIVPNGVDADFFSPVEGICEYDVVFTGNMAYPPNIDAARYLAGEIMPLVWKKRPHARLLLAGASPHSSVKALASDRVSVSGWMDDIRDAYAKSRVFIAPMRIGTGMQNKLLEAMAMELPCITTPLANRPIGTTHGQELLVGTDTAALAGHILGLLEDAPQAEALAKAGRRFVIEHYSWEGTTALLEKLLTGSKQ